MTGDLPVGIQEAGKDRGGRDTGELRARIFLIPGVGIGFDAAFGFHIHDVEEIRLVRVNHAGLRIFYDAQLLDRVPGSPKPACSRSVS